MKKIIFAMLATILATQANAQITYFSMEMCSSDPFIYIELNYVSMAELHVGQTVKNFAEELELPVSPIQIIPSVYQKWEGGDQAKDGFYDGFSLNFYYGDIMYSIGIELNPPYIHNWDDQNSPLYRMSDEEITWERYYKEIFPNNTIKKIWVNRKKDGKWMPETYDYPQERYGKSIEELDDEIRAYIY